MVVVKAQPGEPADSLIRKFNKKVLAEGILTELKKREYYQKPALIRKEKKALMRHSRKGSHNAKKRKGI